MTTTNFEQNFYSRLKAVEDILIPHRHFTETVSRLQRVIELARHGAEPRHTLLLGESGTGKTWIAQYLASLYPHQTEKYGLKIPILLVQTPATPSLKGLAEAILTALGDPVVLRGTASEKRERALGLLRKLKVELIIFDEFQHFLDHGKQDSLISVSDWLKRFIDDASIPCLLMGLPRCEAILQVNEQLRRRFSPRLELLPFSLDTEAEACEFQAVLKEIDKALPNEHLSGLDEETLATRLFYASNGLIGYLRTLITGAFELMVVENRSTLDITLLERAFIEVIWKEGQKALNPFHPKFKLRKLNQLGEPFAIAVKSARHVGRRATQ
ncbi:TniB family NTP-binding protein [Collimonas sp.]|jgi:hypothetical protein|uniref:TniB family NTP-binding protein n=1 Tax=Collimonas sp. TaxID=1963772 RepID=UPI002C0C3D0B|nr:TniB family NTP-binding protein [Collimonas sp.]HWW05904.1 TniB family NTP-binding protein [Collimonas sp.]